MLIASILVENIAFGKDTWLNKERHQKRALEGVVDPTLSEKLSQKAVDGLTANDINQCTIVDNYYDDEPQLTIDLGRRYNVAGIVVYTWLGQMDGEGATTIYLRNKQSEHKRSDQKHRTSVFIYNNITLIPVTSAPCINALVITCDCGYNTASIWVGVGLIV